MAKVTWLGDEDPAAQVVEMFGHTFVKGQAVDVDPKDATFRKFDGNPAFSTSGKADPVSSHEPEPADPEAGTERAALRAELARRGITMKGNPSEDTMRAKLAGAVDDD